MNARMTPKPRKRTRNRSVRGISPNVQKLIGVLDLAEGVDLKKEKADYLTKKYLH